jgi:hypothetical protein
MQPIYLDVCTLCRPYDDQAYLRIHLETSAVCLILKAVQAGYYSMISSPVHEVEIEAISDLLERIELLTLLEECSVRPYFDHTFLRVRAEWFVESGLGPADAAHLAFSEAARADFISCDDMLIKRCARLKLEIWSGTPLSFCEKENLQ